MKIAFQILCYLSFIFGYSSVIAEEPPAELKRLNEQRDREIAKIDEIYMQQLEKLKAKYLKIGDLDAANQVAGILDSFEPTAIVGNWHWQGLGELKLQRNGLAKFYYWKGDGKWKQQKPGVIRVTSDTGRIFEFTIKGDVGTAIHPSTGKPITIKKK